ILYLPGNSDAFHVLESATDLHFWILQRMNTPAARETFLAHFSLADRQQINANLGDLMNRLVATWGRYDHSMINQDNRAVSGDA
ncbi:dermonecrotic toxin domain-containing protein, partial [Mesorhizobium japonicum]